MPKFDTIVFKDVSLNSSSNASAQIYWPGGLGFLLIPSFLAVGTTPALTVEGLDDTDGKWSIGTQTPLSPGAPISITAAGLYEVNLPECLILFSVHVSGSDSLSFSDAIRLIK